MFDQIYQHKINACDETEEAKQYYYTVIQQLNQKGYEVLIGATNKETSSNTPLNFYVWNNQLGVAPFQVVFSGYKDSCCCSFCCNCSASGDSFMVFVLKPKRLAEIIVSATTTAAEIVTFIEKEISEKES